MSVFAVGDPHLALHPDVDKPMDVFGPSWDHHEEQLKRNWLAAVSGEDTVIVAGDISWGMQLKEAMPDLEWLHALPGTKVLIRGNHDLWWHGITQLNRLFDDMVFLQNTCHMIGDLALCGTRGWLCPGTDGFDAQDEKVYRRELLRLEFSLKDAKERGARRIIGILHYPPTNDKHHPSGFTELMSRYGVERVVYGHLHGKEKAYRGLRGSLNGVEYQLVALDQVGFGPVRIL